MFYLEDFSKSFLLGNNEVQVTIKDISVCKGSIFSDNPYDSEDIIEFEYDIVDSTEDLTKKDHYDLENMIINHIKKLEDY